MRKSFREFYRTDTINHFSKKLSLFTRARGQSQTSHITAEQCLDPRRDESALGTPQCIPHRAQASYTVEASLILPLYVTAMAVAISLLSVFTLQWQVRRALDEAVRELALQRTAEVKTQDVALLCEAHLVKNGVGGTLVFGGPVGIRYSDTVITDDVIDAKAVYQVRLPYRLLGRQSARMSAHSVRRRWTGWNPHEKDWDGVFVYITPDGESYHKNPACPYLNLKIHSIAYGQLRTARGAGSHIYHSCPSCHSAGVKGGYVYVADYGTRYHVSLTCPALKRTVEKVRIDEVGGRHACPKCSQ